MSRRSTLVVSMAVAGALACARGPEEQQPGGSGPALKPEAVEQIRAILAQKAARTPAQRRISSQLLFARDGLPTAGTHKLPELQPTSVRDDLGRVLVDVKGALPSDLDVKLAQLGGALVTSSAAHGSARAWIDLSRLEDLAAVQGVSRVRPAFEASTGRANVPFHVDPKAPRFATHAERVAAAARALGELRADAGAASFVGGAITSAGAAQSQGSAAHNAEAARRWYGVDGTGVTVGVLSDSDDFREASIASGDLPADTIAIPGQDGRPGSGEGTAMMEIVHDVAPGARIVFASAFNGPEAFADNIRRLRFEYGCDVIVDDVIYYFESPFQDDIIAQAVNDVTADGAVYVSSAGNQGNLDDGTSGTWEGDFREGGTLDELPGYVVHDFGAGTLSNRIEASGGPLVLHWADRGTLDDPRSDTDYDLFVLDDDLRNVVVAAVDWQNGDDLPFEFLGYNIPSNYRVVVAKPTGAPNRAMRIFFSGGELGLATAGGTYGHNSAREAIGAAAVDAAEAVGGLFVAGATTPVELFSSDGERYVFYDAAGNLIGPSPTFRQGRPEYRKAPYLAAADGVSTTLPSSTGLNPFYGTSAAAPHIAGLAALLKDAAPWARGAGIRAALREHALDIEAVGSDRDSGYGIPEAKIALANIGAKPVPYIELGEVVVTPGAGTALQPGGTGTLAVTLTNTGGALARTVRGTLSSASPHVTVTAGSAAWPDLVTGGSAASATPFAISISPAAPCGEQLALTLTVTFAGASAPSVFDLTVQTGEVSATPVIASVSGEFAIPDSSAAGVNVPIEVAGVGAVGKIVFSVDGTACSTAIGSTTVGLSHTWVGDLVLTLTSPSGRAVRVMSRVGSSGNNLCQTVFDDDAATSIQSITSSGAPWTGTFRPANPLAAFNGEPGDGTWVLNVADQVSSDVGHVRAVSIHASSYVCSAP